MEQAYDMLTLKLSALDLVTSLEAEVTRSDKRVPFVNLLQASTESVGEDETTYIRSIY